MFGLGLRLMLVLLAAPVVGGTLAGHAQALAAKEPNKLVAHRAIYEMTLDDARSVSGITGIDGRMVFEFTGSECDGYSLNMRMVTHMTDSQGQTNLTDLRSSTWEQGDGQKFRFQSAQYLNDKLGDVTMGRAVRETTNEAGKRCSKRGSMTALRRDGRSTIPLPSSEPWLSPAPTLSSKPPPRIRGWASLPRGQCRLAISSPRAAI